MNKKIHISIGADNISESIKDYSKRFNLEPCKVVENKYALWRTDFMNFSISFDINKKGQLRHLGFEENVENFTTDKDCNDIMWESFSFQQQLKEIKEFYDN